MKLTDYLISENLTIEQFVARIPPEKNGVKRKSKTGLTPEGLRLIMAGKRQPRRKTIEKIWKASGGKVTILDLLKEWNRRKAA